MGAVNPLGSFKISKTNTLISTLSYYLTKYLSKLGCLNI
jgi:hypothetical protein